MPSTLRDICFDCASGRELGEFWREVFGGELDVLDSGDSCLIPSADGTGLRYWFNQVPEPKHLKNRVHIDVNLPTAAELHRLLNLGATKLHEVRGDDGTLHWTVMADIEGNEFCAFPPKTRP